MNNIDIETMLKKNLEQIANDEIDEMIRKEVEEFKYKLLSKKDTYIAELMKSIRIFSEQKTIDNMPRYLITVENIYRIEK